LLMESCYGRACTEFSERAAASISCTCEGTNAPRPSQGLSTRFHHMSIPVRNRTAGASPTTVQIIFTQMPANRPKCACASQDNTRSPKRSLLLDAFNGSRKSTAALNLLGIER